MTDARPSRRTFLKITAATSAVALVRTAGAQTASDPAKAGDLLVYSEGPKKGKPVKASDLKVGVGVPAIAVDPTTKAPHDPLKGGVLIVKLATGRVMASSKPNAAGDIVAYSSICTHQGCPIKGIGDLGQGKGNIVCTCHGSIYDPGDNAAVLGGPSPRRLSALPIKLDAGGQVVARAGFTGRVGPK